MGVGEGRQRGNEEVVVNFLKSPPEGWADEAQCLEGAARSGREVTPVPEDWLSDTVVPDSL